MPYLNRWGVPLVYRDFAIPVLQGTGKASYQMWGNLQSRFGGVMVMPQWNSAWGGIQPITGIVGMTYAQGQVTTTENLFSFNPMTETSLQGIGANVFAPQPVVGCADFGGNPIGYDNLSGGAAYYEYVSTTGVKTSVVMPGTPAPFDLAQNVRWGGALTTNFGYFDAELMGYTLANDGFIYTLIMLTNAPAYPYLITPILLKSPYGFRSVRQNATSVFYTGPTINWPPPPFPPNQPGAWIDPASGGNDEMIGQIPTQGQALGGLYWWEGANQSANSAGTWNYFLDSDPSAVQQFGPRVGNLLWSTLFVQSQFLDGSSTTTIQRINAAVTFFQKSGKQYMGIGWCPQPLIAGGVVALPNMEPWLQPCFVLCDLTNDTYVKSPLTLASDIPASVKVTDVAAGLANYGNYSTMQNPIQLWYTETGGMRAIILDTDGSACWVCKVAMETIGYARSANFGYGVP